MAREQPEGGGEEALIQRCFAPLAAGFAGALGLTDDCAVVAPPPGHELVWTTDAVAAGVHFFPSDAPADIAWKALAVNVSDLVAKGATPLAYLMAIALPERPEQAWLAAFAEGLAEAQRAFEIPLAGGDTDRRPGPLTVTISALGSVPAGRMVTRAGATPGDQLFVSGDLGASALGLALRREPTLARSWGLDAAAESALAARYLRPTPKVAVAEPLLAHASAAMDISDGLGKDLGRLTRASGVAADVNLALLPLAAPVGAALARDPTVIEHIVGGGDDYEVLAAVPSDECAAFSASAAAAGVAVTRIGELCEGEGVTFRDRDGRTLPLADRGWDHF